MSIHPEDRDRAYLWDMREAAHWIAIFIHGLKFNQFIEDKKSQSAVERQLEIIGEAANHVTEKFQQDHPQIPWRSMIGLRNILIHEYGEVKAERVWDIATNSIHQLILSLDQLLPKDDENKS